ncbi:MAG: hypothetical protein OEV86_15120 [Candidatus Krumholzibacteria bacterium]|nr:hypothetical protein [Candidatus Krumholzibacteria bacterium]
MTTDLELITRGWGLVGSTLQTLVGIANSYDHEHAVSEAQIMLLELAEEPLITDELKQRCRDAAKRKVEA